MEICKLCVQPDTRPGIVFQDGVCGACLWEKEKEKIDWVSRENELKAIAEEAKSKNAVYDCAIGVSGGKDSTFQALYARDTLGLRCLLVNNEPDGITEIGRHNVENLINLGFDMVKIHPNPKILQKMMKRDFYKFLNPIKATEYCLYASTYIMADLLDIPLLIQGDNPALTLGAMKTGVGEDTSNSLLANQLNTLSEDWKSYASDLGISERELFMYHYEREKLAKKCRGVWLNYYVKDWSPQHNLKFSEAHGLKTRQLFKQRDIGTYAGYYQLDSDLVAPNQMIKYLKFGFGQCVDHACYDIRAGVITREQGLAYVEQFDGYCSRVYVQLMCDVIGITYAEFWRELMTRPEIKKEYLERVFTGE